MPSTIYCTRCGTANRLASAFCFACGHPLQADSARPVRPINPPFSSQGSSFPPINRSAVGLRSGPLSQNTLLKQRYHILNILGTGGFGAVYKAEDRQFGNRLVAIKEMSRGGLSVHELAQATEAFKREAMLLARLKHPSLPSIYDHFTEAGRWYLVMDYIEGETLDDHLLRARGGRLPVEEVLHIGIQLCEVLGYLHNCHPPIIFRDLKPANVIITPYRHIYLIDFGLARLLDPQQLRSPNSTPFGSPGYAAPEQYDNPHITIRADIYSLGATLHQLLTGTNPSLQPFQFAPLEFSPESNLAGLGMLIMRMLETNPLRRPDSMAMVWRELQRITSQVLGTSKNLLRSSPFTPPATTTRVIAQHTPPYHASGPLPARNFPAQDASRTGPLPPIRGMAAISSSNNLKLPAGTVFCIFKGHTGAVRDLSWSPDGSHVASASADKTVRVWNASTGVLLLAHTDAQKETLAVAWSPEGARIASGYNAEKQERGAMQVWSMPSGKLLFATTPHTSFWTAQSDISANTLAWSPDGTRLAAGTGERKVEVWDTRSWKIIATYKGHTGPVLAVAWSPDGRQIASTSSDDAVHIWEAMSGKNINIFYKHASVVSSLAWSPNGQRIASASHDRTVQVWNALTGTTLLTYNKHEDRVHAVSWSPDGLRIVSGGRDGKAQVWDAGKGTQLFTYGNHTGSINALKWSLDSKMVASASDDKTVHIWRAV